MGKYFCDLTGQKFGRLTALERVGRTKHGDLLWRCKCDCGNEHVTSSDHLKSGCTKSCGCLSGEQHHGMWGTRLFETYKSMKARCCNPNCESYPKYGGRGITICDEWLNPKDGKTRFFQWALENGYSDDLTIDRIDVNGNYEPGNCRWTTRSVQSFNRRKMKSKSGIRGVYYRNHDQKYEVRISVENQKIALGYYDNIDDAIAARQAGELKYYGQVLD